MDEFIISEVVYNSGVTFNILDCYIVLFSNETVYGWKTFGLIDDNLHYLNDDYISVETACNLWQYLNNRLLTKEETKIIIKNNNPIYF